MANNILDVVQTIAQVAQANAHHGATDSDGKPIKVGLRREQEYDVRDPRVRLLDGFKVKFSGDKMLLTYQAEVLVSEISETGFETEVKKTLSDIQSFIKKEYRKLASKELNLTKAGDPNILIQNISMVRCVLTATQAYNLKGTEAEPLEVEETSEDKLRSTVKSFLAMGKKKYPNALSPTNVTRKDEKLNESLSGPQKWKVYSYRRNPLSTEPETQELLRIVVATSAEEAIEKYIENSVNKGRVSLKQFRAVPYDQLT